jgi:ribosomal protein S18 acetylase RimI-like enzyme
MKYSMIALTQLNADQTKKLAFLHHRALHSLLTDLGAPFLERYYQLARADSSVIGVCALDAQGNPLGWAVGSPTPGQVARRMSEARGWFIIQMLRALVTNPKTIWQAFLSSRLASVVMEPGAIELTYIGVDESARKKGLGRDLLGAFIEAAREKRFSSVELSVEAGNAAAIALYTRAGFRVMRSQIEGAFNRHRMELILT